MLKLWNNELQDNEDFVNQLHLPIALSPLLPFSPSVLYRAAFHKLFHDLGNWGYNTFRENCVHRKKDHLASMLLRF